MKSYESSAKTIEEAISAGLEKLGASISDVTIDVLEEGSKGLFGLFGSRQAKVRLTLKEEEVDPLAGLTDEPKAKPAPQREKVQPKQEAKVDAPKPVPKAVPAQESKPEPKQEAPKAETVKAKPAPKQDKPKAKPAPRQDKGAEAEKPKAKPAPKAPVQPLEKPEVTMIPADAVEEAHTVLASQLLNEQFALRAGLPKSQMGLGHAFEIDPAVENGFLYELAQAEMAREIFPEAPLKYMPPTKFMTGNIFRGHVQDALFNMVTILTNQKIHLLGMMTEAIHTPFLSDRFLAIQNAQYIFNTMKDLGGEIVFKEGGIMQQRADQVLHKAADLLSEIERLGIFETLEKGIFADIKRPRDGGKGLEGVFQKAPGYRNPFLEPMMKGGMDQ